MGVRHFFQVTNNNILQVFKRHVGALLGAWFSRELASLSYCIYYPGRKSFKKYKNLAATLHYEINCI